MCILGVCPTCHDYNILTSFQSNDKTIASVCLLCASDLKKKNGFADYLFKRAIYFQHEGKQMLLNSLKLKARKSCDNGFITPIELTRIERIFITLQPN